MIKSSFIFVDRDGELVYVGSDDCYVYIIESFDEFGGAYYDNVYHKNEFYKPL